MIKVLRINVLRLVLFICALTAMASFASSVSADAYDDEFDGPVPGCGTPGFPC